MASKRVIHETESGIRKLLFKNKVDPKILTEFDDGDLNALSHRAFSNCLEARGQGEYNEDAGYEADDGVYEGAIEFKWLLDEMIGLFKDECIESLRELIKESYEWERDEMSVDIPGMFEEDV